MPLQPPLPKHTGVFGKELFKYARFHLFPFVSGVAVPSGIASFMRITFKIQERKKSDAYRGPERKTSTGSYLFV